MKRLVLITFVSTFFGVVAQAETVSCKGTLQNEYNTPVDILIEKYPRNSGMYHEYLSAKVTYDYGHKQRKNFTVKRLKASDKMIYKDILDSSSFRLEMTRTGSKVYISKNSAYSQEVTLNCKTLGVLPAMENFCPTNEALSNEELIKAILNGDNKLTEDLVKECNISANFIDKKGCSPLLYAVDGECGNTKKTGISYAPLMRDHIVNLLISSGADLEKIDPADGLTALLKAAKFGLNSTLFNLVESGADINKQDNKGNTALILAVLNRSYDDVKTILSAKPDINLRNTDGKTALDLAKEMDLVDITDLMNNEIKVVTISMGPNGKCNPGMIHIMSGETIALELEAKDKMLHFEADDLEVSLMAMPGSPDKTIITPNVKGTFPYSCWELGSHKTKGSIMVM